MPIRLNLRAGLAALMNGFLVAASALGQSLPKTQSPEPLHSPKSMVAALYHKVVMRHPYSLLDGANIRVFSPYLSKSLLHEIESARACSRDWFRQNNGKAIKAPFAWSEFGIFSGGNERDSPGNFNIEKVEMEADGRFRVEVDLTLMPGLGPDSWRIAVIVVRENSHFVVQDVVFLPDQSGDAEERLSSILSEGCDGSHWVGYH